MTGSWRNSRQVLEARRFRLDEREEKAEARALALSHLRHCLGVVRANGGRGFPVIKEVARV